MIETARIYREFADSCLTQAKAAFKVRDRRTLLRMAEEWLRLASKVESTTVRMAEPTFQ
jgi:hypothetical protein